MVCCFGDLGDQSLDFGDFGRVCGDGDGFCACAEIGQRVEGCDCFIARGGFARGDVDFGAPCLEKSLGKC